MEQSKVYIGPQLDIIGLNWCKKAKNEPGIKHNISYFDNISDFQIKHKFILDNGI